MGVPAFFKWLTIRCPTILLDVLKNYNFDDPDMNADDTPEIDNFYLDMNGIIHPCTHPENIVITLQCQPLISTVLIADPKAINRSRYVQQHL